jgi:acyl-CoA thioesterase
MKGRARMTAGNDAQEIAEKSAGEMWHRDAASQAMGMKMLSVGPGTAIIAMTVRDDMINGHGTCHGSYIFALADSAFAFACNSYGPASVAADCQISFLRPVWPGQVMTATASETFRHGRNGIYDIIVTNDSNETIAVFRGKSRVVGEAATRKKGAEQ